MMEWSLSHACMHVCSMVMECLFLDGQTGSGVDTESEPVSTQEADNYCWSITL